MTEIKKVAVIGSGVMGAAIAAHIANSNTEVVLLDIVPKNAKDRSVFAKNAIEKLLKADPAPLTHKRKAKFITPGNLEDDLALLKNVDWVIEAVLEDVDIKRNLYKILQVNCSADCVISSNTSTLPLKTLCEGMDSKFTRRFMITHFFNPPRYMRLFELITTKDNDSKLVKKIADFADINLGKGVVNCNDTPGFIANRIGCFWMTKAVLTAIELKITVEEADNILSKPIGVPKTGVFGLLDLIGIDLMPLIAKSFKQNLPADDAFLQVYKEVDLITNMIKDGYTGRKGKGGFYRLKEGGGKKEKEVIDLQTGEYYQAQRPNVAASEISRKSLRLMFEYDDKVAHFAKIVMLHVLAYTASLVPEIAANITDVDEAMKLGYNWKYGPFELIDRLGDEKINGVDWLIGQLEKEKIAVPNLLIQAKGKKLYNIKDNKRFYLDIKGQEQEIKLDPAVFMLADKKIGQKPVLKNPSASLWDIGDGILCLEYTSKMNSLDPLILEMIEKATKIVKEGYKGLVIANDGENFSIGANIGVLLFAANVASYSQIKDIIKKGQDVYMGLKYAPFPVVCAPAGMALGGGCEILMHADAIQAHIETYTGLVEVGVGLIPGWGGCKEMILRHLESETVKRLSIAKKGGMFALAVKQALAGEGSASLRHPINTINTMPAISKAFEYIATAKVAKSAEEARDMLILREKDGITMNRKRLLPDAKAKCLELAKNYTPPKAAELKLPGKTAYVALQMAISSFVKTGKATPYDQIVSDALAHVLSGNNTDITITITEQQLLDLEVEFFMQLIKNEGTLDRIENMLENGKPLRN